MVHLNKELNDNEKKGLPASIDLLRVAVLSLENSPGCKRRERHLLSIMERVKKEIS